MAEIVITPTGPGAFSVDVTQRGNQTTHRVSVPPDLLERWGVPEADHKVVVEESFAFLLEREPNTSILPEFELSVIGRYFPDYDRELPRRLT